MSGAMVLCGTAALKSGSGLVQIGAPTSIRSEIAIGNPCYTTIGLPEDDEGRFNQLAIKQISPIVGRASAVVLGPGAAPTKACQEMADYLHAYEQKMKMKRENIANRGFWTAKKRYVLNVWDSEGVRYAKPKMKICGMETARSSTPSYFRDKLLEAYTIIINQTNDELIDYINRIKEDTKNQDYLNIAFPRGCNGLKKYRSSADIYGKGTPIAVRGALLYNYYVKKNKLEHKYPLIQEGEKIKFMYLKEPNPIGENIIAFFQRLPTELNLEKYIDYTTQFEKSFLEPLKNVLECIDWQYERRGSLTSFFS